MRNNYAIASVISWIEGLSAVTALGYLFFDWKVSVIAAAVFVLCLPCKNYARFGSFYPSATSRSAAAKAVMPEPAAARSASPATSEGIPSPMQESAAPLPAKTI